MNKENLTNVIIIQPNIDPYNVKFTLDYQSQFFKTLDLLKNKITNKTDYLVLPETFITDNLNVRVHFLSFRFRNHQQARIYNCIFY